MKNISKVVWYQRAKNDLESILDYLKENWTEKEIRKFFSNLDKQISVIQINRMHFPQRRKTMFDVLFYPGRLQFIMIF